jgi:shikimate kinase
MLEEERNRILTKQKQRMKELQKLLTTRAKAYDSHQSLAQISKSKVKYFRYHERILKLQNIGFQTFFFKKSVDTKI